MEPERHKDGGLQQPPDHIDQEMAAARLMSGRTSMIAAAMRVTHVRG